MLIVFLTFMHIAFLSFSFGVLFKRGFERLTGRAAIKEEASIIMLLGLVILTWISEVVSLFFPLSEIYLVTITILAIVVALIFLRAFKGIIQNEILWPKGKAFWFILPALFIGLAFGAIPSLIPDDRLYYTQFIKWLDAYGVVPGLGNLHGRLAFNSSWHSLAALFNYSFFEDIRFNDLNAFLYVLFAAFAFYPLVKRKRKLSFRFIFRIIAFWGIFFMVKRLSTVSADFVVVVMIWIIAALVIEYFNKNKNTGIFRFWLIVIFSLFSVTVKLSALPVLIIPLVLLIYHFTHKRLVMIIVTAFLFFIPWLIQNFYLSGYLVFPVPQLPAFHVDWSVPKEYVEAENLLITSWAKINSFPNYGFTASEINRMPIHEWFPYWLDIQSENNVFAYVEKLLPKAVFFTGMLALVIAIFLFIFRWLHKRVLKKEYWIMLMVTATGLFFWIHTAPDVRFGIAWLLLPAFYLVSLFIFNAFHNVKQFILYFSSIMYLMQVTLFALYFFFSKPPVYNNMDYWYPGKSLLIMPACSFQPEYKLVSLSNFVVKIPVDSGCADAALPCTQASRLNPSLMMRGKELQCGFSVKNKEANIPAFKKID